MVCKNFVVAIAGVLALNCASPSSPKVQVAETGAATPPEATRPVAADPATPAVATSDRPEASAMIPIRNAVMVKDTLAGGQPSPADYAAIAKAGYTTVIDLRAEGEAGAESNERDVRALGMSYVHLPIASSADLSRETVAKFSEALAAGTGPAVVHCASGNRVGAMFGLKAFWQDGLPAAEALAFGKQAGLTGLEEYVSTQLGIAK